MNKLIITGNLTNIPQLSKRMINGAKVPVCSFSVAVNDGRGEHLKTTYFHVSAWRGLAKACAQYLTKGRKVAVTGPVSVRSCIEGDKACVYLEVNAETIEFLSPWGKCDQPAVYPDEAAAVASFGMQTTENDELPF